MKVYESWFGNIDIPQVDLLTLLFESEHCLAKEDTKIHVECANAENYITKSEARILVKRLAYVLRHRYHIGTAGPGKDVVLAVSSGNPFIPCLFYAVTAAGGIYSGASTAFQLAELTRQIQDAEATLLVCSGEYHNLMLEAAEKCNIPKERVLVLDSHLPSQWKVLSCSNGEDVLASALNRSLDWYRFTTQDELANITTCLLYSSGTTGLPKGVRISNRALVASCVLTMHVARRYKERCKRQGKDFHFNTIAHLPMANIAGIDMYCANPFYMGGTSYWMKQYDFHDFIKYHRQFRPDFQFSVPPIWLRIAKSEEVTDHFDGLHVATTGSAPIGYETAREVQAKLGKGKALMTQTYGTTESSGSICSQDYHIHDASWSVGHLCPNTSARVVDDEHQDVADGEAGELWIASPFNSQGYHNRPDATREAFVDGYYRTGDIAAIRDQKVYILDRKKELIKYKAQQIAPAELEALLHSHPKIADAAVIGMQDRAQQTEVPRAYVVRKQSASDLSAEEVKTFVKQNLAPYKQLRGGVVFVDEIPKSMSGKILRKELRLLAAETKAKL